MAAIARCLVDTSALARLRHPQVAAALAPLIEAGARGPGALSRGGRIRAVGLPELLIAAVAERERVTVLRYDGDYELIAQITGQAAQWVVPRGTVP